uniref:Uncharacterized protein n=1 Tax=Panagrolaimus sp. ES5 TaxID=591445 RepID=A0AC34FQP7_9BILA
MEDENEKFIYNFTNSEDCFGLSAQNPVSEHVFVETDVSKLQRWFSNNQRLPDEFDKNYEVYDNIIEIESSFKWMNIKDIHQTIRRLVTSSKTAEDIDEVISLLLDLYVI